MGTGGPDRRACLEGSECFLRSDPRDAGEVRAQEAGVLAGGQAFHIWVSRRRASGAWEKPSPRLSQLLRLLLNLRTG